MVNLRWWPAVALALAACGSGDDESLPVDTGDPPEPPNTDGTPPSEYDPSSEDPTATVDHGIPDLAHTFPAVSLGPGEELGSEGKESTCLVWHVGNPEPFWVNKIVATNDGGFHHSNWFVYDESFSGFPPGGVDDGLWRGCPATSGIGVGNVAFFFAQSTQALSDVQEFREGAAFEVPANAIIMGDLHLLNTSTAALDTRMSFDIYTVDEADVDTPLLMATYSIQNLAVPPNVQSTATMDCAFSDSDVEVHYALSHYHQWGTAMRVETDGRTFFETEGEASGHRLDPPVLLGSNVKLACDYANDSGSMIPWENSGAGEMCVFMMFTSGRNYFGLDIVLPNMDPTCVSSGDAVR